MKQYERKPKVSEPPQHCALLSSRSTQYCRHYGLDCNGGYSRQRLLLNHISTPHVILASAVAASCALPGVMTPAKLETKKNSEGQQELFEVDKVKWIDGSVQADLPFKRISNSM